MFIELQLKPINGKGEYTLALLNVSLIKCIEAGAMLIDGREYEYSDSYADIKEMLNRHNLLISE